MWIKSPYYFAVMSVLCATVSLSVALIQPYKSAIYNKVDTILTFNLVLLSACLGGYITTLLVDPINKYIPLYSAAALYFVPLLYIIGYLCYNVCLVKKLPRKYITKCMRCIQHKLKTEEINEVTAFIR